MAGLDPEFEKMLDGLSLESLRAKANANHIPVPFPPEDDEFCESHVHPTPNGGDYSTAYFYDKEGHPCRKADAAYVNIVEFKRGGERVNESYGEVPV